MTLRFVLLLLLLVPGVALGADDAAHADPFAGVVLELAIVLMSAKLGGSIAVRLGQPAVLGELLIGMLLGNLKLVGITALDEIKTDSAIDLLSHLGVLILLFEVGLESTIRQMMQVGLSSLLVALLGVVAPFALGWLASAWLLPDVHSSLVHVFVGATLTATSVGITARVLKDLGRSQSPEARVILGAAVIDDVLGLVILAVVTGIITANGSGSQFAWSQVAVILVKSVVFLSGSVLLGMTLSPRLFRLASQLSAGGVLLATGLSFCFVLAFLASAIGLAPIVGAFAAGLVLEDVHYKSFINRGEHNLEELIHPIASFLVPIFFVVMGMRTDLGTFAQPGVLGLAAILTLVAIVGKQVCSLGVLDRSVDRLSIGLGMVPRGEVGLIFANVGLNLSIGGRPIVSPALYSAIVVVVIVTTMVTPAVLKWSLQRRKTKR